MECRATKTSHPVKDASTGWLSSQCYYDDGKQSQTDGEFLPSEWFILPVKSTLPPSEREILILRIGWHCRSEYEFGWHTFVGKSVGLTDEEVKRITEGPKAAGWDLFDATLLQAVDELYYDAFITDATWNALAKRYNQQQLIDVVATVGEVQSYSP